MLKISTWNPVLSGVHKQEQANISLLKVGFFFCCQNCQKIKFVKTRIKNINFSGTVAPQLRWAGQPCVGAEFKSNFQSILSWQSSRIQMEFMWNSSLASKAFAAMLIHNHVGFEWNSNGIQVQFKSNFQSIWSDASSQLSGIQVD